MHIVDFVSNYKNHPVLFVGTGLSLRYLKHSFTWDGLLKKIALDLSGRPEYYLDLKSNYEIAGKYRFDKIASELEKDFNEYLKSNRDGKFKDINDIFYENMSKNINMSRFKIYISKLLSKIEFKIEMSEELAELKKVRKNIGSIITTNYDKQIEEIFEFNSLIGNDILLSNPYGSLYKIHGCVDDAAKMIITKEDYDSFNEKYELIRAQLLSLFIHNPIIFLGYNIGDENIKSILKTIFTYIEPNSEEALKIRKNFLLVEYEENNQNEEVIEHDIDMEGFSTIRINKIKTDNFKCIYKALAELHLPISAMDVRKVQNIVSEIYAGGNIKVNITEDLDSLKNEDRIIAIGSPKTISYKYHNPSQLMTMYFKIIEESNNQVLELIDQIKIAKTQYFPIYGFCNINKTLKKEIELKKNQEEKLKELRSSIKSQIQNSYDSIDLIEADDNISKTNKINAIIWGIFEKNISLENIESFLKSFKEKNLTNYKKMLCVYDYMKYNQDI